MVPPWVGLKKNQWGRWWWGVGCAVRGVGVGGGRPEMAALFFCFYAVRARCVHPPGGCATFCKGWGSPERVCPPLPNGRAWGRVGSRVCFFLFGVGVGGASAGFCGGFRGRSTPHSAHFQGFHIMHTQVSEPCRRQSPVDRCCAARSAARFSFRTAVIRATRAPVMQVWRGPAFRGLGRVPQQIVTYSPLFPVVIGEP